MAPSPQIKETCRPPPRPPTPTSPPRALTLNPGKVRQGPRMFRFLTSLALSLMGRASAQRGRRLRPGQSSPPGPGAGRGGTARWRVKDSTLTLPLQSAPGGPELAGRRCSTFRRVCGG